MNPATGMYEQKNDDSDDDDDMKSTTAGGDCNMDVEAGLLSIMADEEESEWIIEGTGLEDKKKKWNDDVNQVCAEIKRYGMTVRDHVMEIYSPERVTSIAQRLGLRGGIAMDLTTIDPEDGELWDFNKPDKRRKAKEIVESKRALLIILSPMCTAFSTLQNMNKSKMCENKWNEMLDKAKSHVTLCMELIKIQIENHMYFLYEHPDKATSGK